MSLEIHEREEYYNYVTREFACWVFEYWVKVGCRSDESRMEFLVCMLPDRPNTVGHHELFERWGSLKLTRGEKIQYVAGEMASLAKYAIRMERHGNYDTPGGLASD